MLFIVTLLTLSGFYCKVSQLWCEEFFQWHECYIYCSRWLRPGKEQPLPSLEEYLYWLARWLFKAEIVVEQRRKIALTYEQSLLINGWLWSDWLIMMEWKIIFLSSHTHAIVKFFFVFFLLSTYLKSLLPEMLRWKPY